MEKYWMITYQQTERGHVSPITTTATVDHPADWLINRASRDESISTSIFFVMPITADQYDDIIRKC